VLTIYFAKDDKTSLLSEGLWGGKKWFACKDGNNLYDADEYGTPWRIKHPVYWMPMPNPPAV